MSKWRNFVHLSVLTRWEIKSTKMNEREWILLCTSIDCVRPSSFHMHHGYQYDRIEPAMNWQWMKMMRLRLNYTHLNTWWQSRQQQKCLFYFALFFNLPKMVQKQRLSARGECKIKHIRERWRTKKKHWFRSALNDGAVFMSSGQSVRRCNSSDSFIVGISSAHSARCTQRACRHNIHIVGLTTGAGRTPRYEQWELNCIA